MKTTKQKKDVQSSTQTTTIGNKTTLTPKALKELIEPKETEGEKDFFDLLGALKKSIEEEQPKTFNSTTLTFGINFTENASTIVKQVKAMKAFSYDKKYLNSLDVLCVNIHSLVKNKKISVWQSHKAFIVFYELIILHIENENGIKFTEQCV